jgi:hypothetical protein
MTMTPQEEMQAAEAARVAGNEGKARVCARRGAGWAVRGYYQRLKGQNWGGDAFHQLKTLRDDETQPEALRAAAGRLTTQVNHDHAMPFDDDVLADARMLIAAYAEPVVD